MLLTNKAKEDFENYVLNKNLGHDSEVLISVYNQETLFIDYKDVKKTLLNALIIEWFDSVKIHITSDYFELNKGFYSEILDNNFAIVKPTRQEALIEAIKKANEIYNEKYSISQ